MISLQLSVECFSIDVIMYVQIKGILDEITDKLPDEFVMADVMGRVAVEERTPYVIVAFQECERMNGLTSEIRRTLKELNLGLKVTRIIIWYTAH